jgi:hypothetical protein
MMTRLAQLRIVVPVGDGVRVDALQKHIRAFLRERGAETLNGPPVEGALPLPDDADRAVHWMACDVRRGAETRAGGKRGGRADGNG